jgi:hypothetical protein
LNAGEPVEKPQAHRAGDVKNHFPDFNLDVLLRRLHLSHFIVSNLSEGVNNLDDPVLTACSRYVKGFPRFDGAPEEGKAWLKIRNCSTL